MASLLNRQNFDPQSFSSFSFFLILDKTLNLLLLYFLLKVNLESYNDLEYVISIASIAHIFLESGLSSYAFEEFRISTSPKLIIKYFRGSLSILLSTLILTVIIAFISSFELFAFVGIQIGYFAILKLETSIWRLVDRPSIPYKFGALFSIICIALTILSRQFALEAIFGFRFSLILVYSIWYFNSNWKKIWEIYFNSWNYSLPINSNIVLNMFMLNVVKIFGWNHLDSSKLSSLNIIFRVSSLINIFHTSISGFLMKSNYHTNSYQLRMQRIKNHAKLIFVLTAFLSVLMIVIMNFNLIELNVSSLVIIGVLLKGALSNISSYSEVFLARVNKRWLILLSSASGLVVFFILINFLQTNINTLIASVSLSYFTIILIRTYYVQNS